MADVGATTGKSPAPSQPPQNGGVAAPAGAATVPSSAKDAALSSLVDRLGYAMVQENGQRKLGPPPDWDGAPPPPRGCEVFIGKIPRDCFEDELVPVFERIGRIYEVRMMMDFNGANRGYCFVTYTNRADAKRAVREMNDYEIRERRYLGVCLSVDNCRLFVGGIPLDKQRSEIIEEMRKVTEGVVDAIVYPSVADKTKNRGFTFVEYDSHRAAAMARRKLLPGRIQLWGQPIAVDWAEPEQEVDEEVMSKVKILYVRNLMLSTTEQAIDVAFNQAAGKDGAVERVKKLKDYAFVHFRERGDALRAMNALNGADLEGSTIEVVLAKPVSRDSATAAAAAAAAAQSNLHHMPGKATTVITYPGVSTHQFVTGPELYAASAAAANGIRGMSGGARGMPISPRGSFNGRGRSAAGSRGAGGISRVYSQRNAYRQTPTSEAERMYEIHPGMELIPIHPLTLKPVQHKHPTQLLEEYCQKNGWENPVFQLHSTYGRDGTGDIQLFLYKVFIPSLSQNYFMPNRLSRSIEEAKKIAAEYVLLHIGIPVEGVYQFPYPPPMHAGFHSY